MRKNFHHIGIPTRKKHEGEIYLESIKLYITDASKTEHGIEWIRPERGCTLPPLLQTTAHAAFTVDNLDAALKGRQVIVEPFEPLPGIRVAFVVEDGAPVEYLQFS